MKKSEKVKWISCSALGMGILAASAIGINAEEIEETVIQTEESEAVTTFTENDSLTNYSEDMQSESNIIDNSSTGYNDGLNVSSTNMDVNLETNSDVIASQLNLEENSQNILDNSQETEIGSLDSESQISIASNDPTPQSETNSNDEYSEFSGYYVHQGGGWADVLKLEDDGSFWVELKNGYSWDTGEDYPNGTIYTAYYKGYLSDLNKVDENTNIVNLNITQNVYEGLEQEILDGYRYIYLQDLTDIVNNTILNIILPGAPEDVYPEKVLSWDTRDERLSEITFYTENNDSYLVYFRRALSDYETTYERIQKLKGLESDINNYDVIVEIPKGLQKPIIEDISEYIRIYSDDTLTFKIYNPQNLSTEDFIRFLSNINIGLEDLTATGTFFDISNSVIDLPSNENYALYNIYLPKESRSISNILTFSLGNAYHRIQLDYVPRNLLLDSDNDGIPDIWETEGIDIDHDGNIDIDLSAIGASVGQRDFIS